MRPPLRLALLLVAVILSAPSVRAAEPTALDGMYTAEGVNADGSEYRVVVKIVRRGDSFLVAWIYPQAAVGEATVLVPRSGGVGVTNGDMLAVSYYGQDLTGVVLYRIEEGGRRLVGRWVAANGEGAVQSETLTRLPAPAAPPDTSRSNPPPKTPGGGAPVTVVTSRGPLAN